MLEETDRAKVTASLSFMFDSYIYMGLKGLVAMETDSIQYQMWYMVTLETAI